MVQGDLNLAGVRRLEDLVAWQRAMSLTIEVYRATVRFPSSARYGLTTQVRRAAVSIPSNIAEGFGREDTQDMLRFFRIARGSLFELRTQLLIAQKLEWLAADDAPTNLIEETDRVLQALIRSLQSDR